MINESTLTWMIIQKEPPGKEESDADKDETAEEWVCAAKAAVNTTDRSNRRSSTGGDFVGVVEMLAPTEDSGRTCGSAREGSLCGPDTFAELKGLSTSWAPPKPMERQGHPAHSLAAFEAVYELQERIGKGGYAIVHKAVRRRTGAAGISGHRSAGGCDAG